MRVKAQISPQADLPVSGVGCFDFPNPWSVLPAPIIQGFPRLESIKFNLGTSLPYVSLDLVFC